jgi:hypothetical protein
MENNNYRSPDAANTFHFLESLTFCDIWSLGSDRESSKSTVFEGGVGRAERLPGLNLL